MKNQQLETIQTNIYNFLEKANAILKDDPFHYNGQFISGCLESPDILFIGINPGFDKELWKKPENRKAKKIPFDSYKCKYIEENKYGDKLAKQIVKYLLNGNEKLLDNCAETSFKSFFATPKEDILNLQLGKLASSGLQLEHQKMMQESIETILEEIKPKNIVCIGKENFSSFINFFNLEDKASIEQKMKNGDFYIPTSLKGIPIHGITKHLSWACPQYILDELKNIFKSVIN